MNRNISLVVLMILATTVFVSADFNMNYGGTKIFTVATNATTTVVNLTVSELIYSIGNITTEAYFVGSGQYLTGITVEDNSTEISYHNITDIPTCTAGNTLNFDGTDFSCAATTIAVNSTTISINNVTDVPTCGANTHLSYDGSVLSCSADVIAENTTTISYHNVTDIPTCGAGTYLTFSGTALSCTTPTVATDWTNNAWLNESQTFTEYNEFTKYVNITEGVRLMTDTAVITRDGIENVNITIDSTGNINFNLG